MGGMVPAECGGCLLSKSANVAAFRLGSTLCGGGKLRFAGKPEWKLRDFFHDRAL